MSPIGEPSAAEPPAPAARRRAAFKFDLRRKILYNRAHRCAAPRRR